MGKYFREIDLSEKNSAHTKIINLVGSNKRILEFGCASGYMSKVLKEKFNCELVGLEINREDAKEAETYCKEVIVGDIENLEWCEKLSGSRFDVAIFADVLEHLKDPKAVLIEVKNVLSEDGYILVSVPNIANTSIRLELLLGSFEYEELGILDNTHLKYFTLKSLINLIEDAGFYIELVDYVVKDIPAKIIEETLKLIDLKSSKKTLNYFSGIESIAYEFVVKALNLKPKGYTSYIFKEIKKPERVFEKVFQEQARQIEGKDSLIKEQAQQIEAKDSLIQGHIQQIEAKDTHISNLETTIKDKDAHVGNLEEELRQSVQVIEEQARQIEAKDSLVQEQAQQIEAKDSVIQEQAQHIQAKDAHIGSLIEQTEKQKKQLQAKDTHIGNLGEQIGQLEREVKDKDGMIQEQTQELQAKDSLVQEQAKQIQGKDAHIHNIESELNLIKGSKVWRAAEFFRRLFYVNLLRRFPLLQKGMLTISREGFRAFQIKAKRKLGDVYRSKKGTLQKKQKVIFYNKQIEPYETFIKNNEIHPHIRKLIFDASTQFRYRPLISIIMPVYNVEPRWLKAAVNSVIEQIYTNWELCIADDASTNNETLELLKGYESHDRIKIVFRTRNGNICAASNSAADQAKGEFVAFMDNDDVLAPNALFEIVRLLQDHPNTDLIYSDEDKIDENDKRYDPQFKPDWSPELFLSYNYVNHFTCIRRKIFESVGRFRTGYEGAQDYDIILRAIEKTNKIRHIPKVLYHWRAIKGSVALEARDKPIVHTSALKGLRDHLKRKGIEAALYQPEFAKSLGLPINQIDWPDNGPSVAIIVPTYNQCKLLKKCIESIIQLTTYANYEIMVVDNDSDDRDTLNYLEDLVNKGIRVERIGNNGRPFSFSRINNLAVQRVDTEYILFLNNDIELLEPRWLSRLAGYLSIPGVGVAGAKLLYPNNKIQHAGVVLGMHGGFVPDHAFLNHHKDKISYYFMAEVARNCSAVTGSCLITRRSDFIRIRGFNERDFKVSLQDVDYCLRLAQEGLRTVYVASAELIHHEAMSRQQEDDPRELAQLRKTYVLNDDPYYNPNLSKINSFAPGTDCGIVDYSKFLKTPLKVIIFTHNLELAGAPKAMHDLAVGLKNQSAGKIITKVVSPVPGPFQSMYDHEGIECHVIDLNSQNIIEGWRSKLEYDAMIKKVKEFLEKERPNVVITNTVFGFYVIHASQQQNFPIIWIISESFTPTELECSINDLALEDCIRSFAQAYRVVFGSAATMSCYESFNSQNNFEYIHNSINRSAIDKFIKEVSKEKAHQRIKAPKNKKVLLMVGTICERKGQKAIVEAATILKKERNDFCFYLVGATMRPDDEYLQNIYREVKNNNLANNIKIFPETEELYWYYRAADIFVFTSNMECYPLAIIEAMAFGLPVITTPCYGVKEQVRDVNGLFFDASNINGFAMLVSTLLDDEVKLKYLGKNSRAIFEYKQTYKEMIEKYKHLVFRAWMRGKNRNKK